MRQFYLEFPIVHALRGQLNWTHYKILLPIKNNNERNYYINQTILNNLSSRELDRLIKSKAFDRLSYADKEHIEIVNNNEVMDITDMIKDPIILNVNSKYHKFTEKVLHELLMKQLETRFLELGVGFTLAGHEYKIQEGNHTYRIDLLFFNYDLNAFVVVELKTRSMTIKDIDQVNYYVSLVDKHVKRKNHRKTIGILIAKEKDKYVIKYAINKDIYVSSYLLKQEHVV